MADNIFIKGISIKNYKSLVKFENKGFGKVNLITGNNNSGKTTFLEALFLTLGPTNPALAIGIMGRRGLERISTKQNPIRFLFHHADTSKSLQFTVNTLNHDSFDYKIDYRHPTAEEIPSSFFSSSNGDAAPLSTTSSDIKGVTLLECAFYPAKGEKRVAKAFIKDDGIHFEGNSPSVFPDSVFLSAHVPNLSEAESTRYDSLNKFDRVKIFEKMLRIFEPDLKRTSLGIENGVTLVHADCGFGLVPLTVLGSGNRRLASILLAISYAKDGIVIIDEIENSFHYSLMEKVWEAIAEFAKTNNTQIFATTHSDECIKSAHNAFRSSEKGVLVFHRLSKKENKAEMHTFDDEQLDAMLETGWELR